ncbi:MAG: tetratricopeptide repeat protein [Pseudomonadota bacterium]|nr:tetratricopeptide repeat protein [Pseudomonadota bacterium]
MADLTATVSLVLKQFCVCGGGVLLIRRILWAGFLAAVVNVAAVAGSSTPETFVEAMGWYRAQAENGHAQAQFLYGYMHETGQGVARDEVTARHWYAKASAQGDAGAQYRLARLYQDGRGGGIDPVRAARWYRAAAEQDHRDAQSMLGYLHAMGHGVARDDVQAYFWFTLAAAASDEQAAINRDRLITLLTPEQIAAGDVLVEAW